MRFISFYKPAKDNPNAAYPPKPAHLEKIAKLVEQEMKAGVLIATDGLIPGGQSLHVSYRGGDFSVTDGPFAEAKELIAGYAILRVGSKAEAIAASKRFLEVAGDGETSLHQLHDASLTD